MRNFQFSKTGAARERKKMKKVVSLSPEIE
jgi:hypothetical protein